MKVTLLCYAIFVIVKERFYSVLSHRKMQVYNTIILWRAQLCSAVVFRARVQT